MCHSYENLYLKKNRNSALILLVANKSDPFYQTDFSSVNLRKEEMRRDSKMIKESSSIEFRFRVLVNVF